eukprot:CAMPEP_0119302446 /NCGR_PEP_ID=MMETSP1333-20130426/4034_1 /TAXON_ID=418940 /ORGANISM="Scyphosphaera apsteinii, Strain RCC1455" /LENGTH=146 /DNA_ID=CAMNT_0007304793 /DNA_START=424 /DNA_END=861 /DNA_ORIENTATION=-
MHTNGTDSLTKSSPTKSSPTKSGKKTSRWSRLSSTWAVTANATDANREAAERTISPFKAEEVMRAVATAKQGGDCMQEHHGNDMVTCPASDSLDAIMREADELIVGASPRKQQAVRSMARAHSLDVFMQVFDAQRKRDPYQSASTR